jgi:hypothetical protein
MALIRTPWTRQPQGPVSLLPGSDWYAAINAGVNVTTGEIVMPGLAATPNGVASTVQVITPRPPTPINIKKSASWSILFNGALTVKASAYPYFLGVSGASTPFSLALNHGSYANRAAFYDGSAVVDSGVSLPLGEIASIGLTFDSSTGLYSWYKNGVSYNSNVGANIGGNAWQYVAAEPGINSATLQQILLAFANKALSPNQMRQATANPWQIFAPQSRRVWVPAVASAGAYTLTASPGSYSTTGQSAAILRSRTLVTAPGAYSVTGRAATVTRGRVLAAAAGSYVSTGQAATIKRSRWLAASAGSYTVAGQPATISYTGTATQYTLTAAEGSYSTAGQAATIRRSRRLGAASGAYVVTGRSAAIRYSGAPVAAGGVYFDVLSGKLMILRSR